jgi:hypothetical protein
VAQVDAVFGHSGSVWMLQTDMALVIIREATEIQLHPNNMNTEMTLALPGHGSPLSTLKGHRKHLVQHC